MKEIIFTLLFSSFAMANWYELNALNCRFSNGTGLKYSIKNPSVAIGTYGVMTKNYQVDAKVVYSETLGKSDMSWMLSDPMTARYQLHFNLNPKSVQLNKSMENVATTMTVFVPLMTPVWYPATSSKVVASGTCDLTLKNWSKY